MNGKINSSKEIIMVIDGPNINMLGRRQTEIYGTSNYDELKNLCYETANLNNIELDFRQSNHEGIIIDWIQSIYGQNIKGLIINPAGYSHTSIAILDSLLMLTIPIIEVHLSDIKNREIFRQISLTSQAALEVISGEGIQGYVRAINKICNSKFV